MKHWKQASVACAMALAAVSGTGAAEYERQGHVVMDELGRSTDGQDPVPPGRGRADRGECRERLGGVRALSPGEYGYSLITRIRALPTALGGNVPAAAITGSCERGSRHTDAEAHDHLTG